MSAQSFNFVFKDSELGRLGQCPVQIRTVLNGRTLVVITEHPNTGCGAILPRMPAIATQLVKKHLRGMNPTWITWVHHTPAIETGSDRRDETFQKVSLVWDGERFGSFQLMARLNRHTFSQVIGEAC